MQWNLENMIVHGLYLGDIPVVGRVRLSRVQFGGGVCHHVDLETPINVYGSVRESVTLDHKYVTRVLDSNLMEQAT